MAGGRHLDSVMTSNGKPIKSNAQLSFILSEWHSIKRHFASAAIPLFLLLRGRARGERCTLIQPELGEILLPEI
jgi:hypothetical protein